MDEWIDNFTLTALKACEGDQQKADYFLNCKIGEYFYRLAQRGKYVDWANKELKKK